MYGLIHRYLKDHIIENAGDAVWREIVSELHISPVDLVSQEVYDDTLTFELVEVASRKLGQPISDCLHGFGRFWISQVSKNVYRAIMDFTGRDLVTFLKNLDRMHHSVAAAMPKARLPSFSLVEESAERLVIRYRSERSGLEPFVSGLLEGLLDRFDIDGTVERLDAKGASAYFLIDLQ